MAAVRDHSRSRLRRLWRYANGLVCAMLGAVAAAPLVLPPLPLVSEWLGTLFFTFLFPLLLWGFIQRVFPTGMVCKRALICWDLVWLGAFAGGMFVLHQQSEVQKLGWACFVLSAVGYLGALVLEKPNRWILPAVALPATVSGLGVWWWAALNPWAPTPKQATSTQDLGVFQEDEITEDRAPGETLVVFFLHPTQTDPKMMVRLKYTPGGDAELSRWLLTGPGPALHIADVTGLPISAKRAADLIEVVTLETPWDRDQGGDSVLDGTFWGILLIRDEGRRICGAISPLEPRGDLTSAQQAARNALVAVSLAFLEGSGLRFNKNELR